MTLIAQSILLTYQNRQDQSYTGLLVSMREVSAIVPLSSHGNFTNPERPFVICEVTHAGTTGSSQHHLLDLVSHRFAFSMAEEFETNAEALVREVEAGLAVALPADFVIDTRVRNPV